MYICTDKISFAAAVLRMANWATEILLYGQPLLKFPSQRPNRAQPGAHAHMEPARLVRCAHVLRSWFDYVLTVPRSGFTCFTAIEWSYFVITIILGLKLSFPLPHDCPSWDHASARAILDMGSFFEKFTSVGGGGSDVGDDDKHQLPASTAAMLSSSSAAAAAEGRTPSSTDVLSASKVVVGIVQRRYDRRVAALNAVAAAADQGGSVASVRNCPMFDGSMDAYLETWDDVFVDTVDDFATTPAASVVMPQTGFHDVWATMTMGWGQAGGYY